MKILVVTFLCLLPFIFGQDYICSIDDDDSSYDLTGLYKSQGNAYAAKDEFGNIYYFNLCGTLANLAETELGCDASSSVCVQSINGNIFSAGRPEGVWSTVSEDEDDDDDDGVSIAYGNGDVCYNTAHFSTEIWSTTIEITCDEDATELTVISVNSTGCQNKILAASADACPTKSHHRHHSHGVNIVGVVLGLVSACACLFCVCACCRRRRRRCLSNRVARNNIELTSNRYQPVPQNFNVSVVPTVQPRPQQPVHPVQPQFVPFAFPPMQQPQFLPPQFQPVQPPAPYFQPSSTTPYFMYGPQVTVPQPSVPMMQTNAMLQQRDFQFSDDERVARELQAKFDQE